MARSSYDTLLSLDRYAKVMGLNPAHFNQGAAATIFPVKSNRCVDIIPQYGWQYSEHTSREDIGEAIAVAESDIAQTLGYYPAPKYIAQEAHMFPRHHRPDLWRTSGKNVRGAQLSVTTNFAKVISMGQRNADTLVGTATVGGLATLTYDYAALTATIVLPSALTDTCELKLFTAGHSGAQEWEVRPFTSIVADGVNVTIVLPSWQLIKPTLWEAYPTTSDFGAIDITDNDNHEQSVELYRIYTDTTVASSTFYWEPAPNVNALTCGCGGASCVACSLTTQDGCLHLRDPELGIVVPTPATYDSDEEAWEGACYSVCRDPDQVKLYYHAGAYSQRYLSGRFCDPLSDAWARAIAQLATARLERPFCQCGSVTPAVIRAQKDMAMTGGPESFSVPFNLLDNPFGTRWGEVQAWRQVSRVQDRVLGGGTF